MVPSERWCLLLSDKAKKSENRLIRPLGSQKAIEVFSLGHPVYIYVFKYLLHTGLIVQNNEKIKKVYQEYISFSHYANSPKLHTLIEIIV